MDGFWEAPNYSTNSLAANQNRRRTFARPKLNDDTKSKPEDVYNRMVENAWVIRW